MGQLQQAVRFRTQHNVYNEGEVATFPREEAERLIAIRAADPYSTEAPQPTTEQEFIPQKEVEKRATAAAKAAGTPVRGLATTDVSGPAVPAGLGAQPAGQMATVFPVLQETEEEAKAREARDKAAEKFGDTDGPGEVDEYDGVRRALYGPAYADAAAKGLVDPAKEQHLRRPLAMAAAPGVVVGSPAQSAEDKKLGDARAKAAKKSGSKKSSKKGAKGSKPSAGQVGRNAAAQGVGTGAQAGQPAANQARDTKTQMRNRGEGLGPASPKESTRNPA